MRSLKRGPNGELYCETGHRADSAPMITDAAGGRLGLHRPGFRIATNDRHAQQLSVIDAEHARYQTRMANAYKLSDGQVQCPACDASGWAANGGVCSKCLGEGVIDESDEDIDRAFANTQTAHEGLPRKAIDSRALADHHARMQQIYSAQDLELSQTWRMK